MEKYQQLMNIIRSLPSLDSYYYVIRNYYSYRDKGVCIIENLLRTLLVKIAPFLDIEIDDNKRPISVINYGMCDFTTSDSLKKFRKKHDGCYLLICLYQGASLFICSACAPHKLSYKAEHPFRSAKITHIQR